MGAGDSDQMEDIFFTFRRETGEEHLSPSQVLAAQEEQGLYPFIGTCSSSHNQSL